MKAIYKKRLLNVARALRESKEPKAFDMSRFHHDGGTQWSCGTPACALGHYASRRDLQKFFKVTREVTGWGEDYVMVQNLGAAEDHFGITEDEYYELFDSTGCGEAQTVKQAARYIERFVARKEREERR